MGMYGESTGWLTWGALGLLTLGVAVAEPALADGPGSQPAGVHGRLQAVPFEKVRVDDPFWSPRIETIQDVTIPDLLAIAEEQGKIDNVRLVAGRKKTGRIRMYNSPDSDIWKIMEAASYTLAWRPSAKIEEKLDELIDLYAAAQASDGYINTMFTAPRGRPRPGWGTGRTSNSRGRSSNGPTVSANCTARGTCSSPPQRTTGRPASGRFWISR